MEQIQVEGYVLQLIIARFPLELSYLILPICK